MHLRKNHNTRVLFSLQQHTTLRFHIVLHDKDSMKYEGERGGYINC